MRRHVGDGVEVAEADHSGQRRMNLSPDPLCRADLCQELVIRQVVPDVPDLDPRKAGAIPADRVSVQLVDADLFENAGVRRDDALVANHRLDRFALHHVVALAVASIRALEHVMSDEHGTIMTIGSRHFDDDHLLAVAIDCIHAAPIHDIQADLLGVVGGIPETLDQRVGILDALNEKRMIVAFLDAQQNDAAICVRERAVGLPKGVRQRAERLLAFRVQTLALLDDGNDVLFRPLHRFSA